MFDELTVGPQASDSRFTANSAMRGGALYATGASLTLNNTTFSLNSAESMARPDARQTITAVKHLFLVATARALFSHAVLLRRSRIVYPPNRLCICAWQHPPTYYVTSRECVPCKCMCTHISPRVHLSVVLV